MFSPAAAGFGVRCFLPPLSAEPTRSSAPAWSIGRLLANAFGVERLPMDGPETIRGWAFASTDRSSERRRLQPERETLSSDPSLYLKDHTSTHQTFADAVGCG